jgi:hypothetical protein
MTKKKGQWYFIDARGTKEFSKVRAIVSAVDFDEITKFMNRDIEDLRIRGAKWFPIVGFKPGKLVKDYDETERRK